MMRAKKRSCVRNSLLLSETVMNKVHIAQRKMAKKDSQISVAGLKTDF